jgi:glycosyltransferase involved in cell wall biosynthesis
MRNLPVSSSVPKRNRRASVYFLTNTLFGGGAEKQLLLSAAGLAERGWNCTIYCLSQQPYNDRYGDLIRQCQSNGVKIHISNPFISVAKIVEGLIESAASRERPILWTWGFRAEACRALIPILWWPRGFVALRSASAEEVSKRRWLLEIGSLTAEKYIANSYRGRDLAIAGCNRLRTASAVIYNAVEAPASAPAVILPRPAIIGLLANIRYKVKGIDFALEIAEKVAQLGREFTLRIGGRQLPNEPDLTSEIKRMGLEQFVEYVGPVSKIEEFMEGIDIYLLTSRTEGMPNSLLEALAFGKPCIATDVGDVRRIAEMGACIKVIAPGDLKAGVAAVLEHLACMSKCQELGLLSRRICRNIFSLESMLDSTEEALAESSSQLVI